MKDKLFEEAKIKVLMGIRGVSRKEAVRLINLQRREKTDEEAKSDDVASSSKISKHCADDDEGEFMSAEEFFKEG